MNKYILTLIICVSASVYSQNYLLRFDAIPVQIGSVQCVSAMNGGIDVPRYQFADMDGDGDLDLFIYDKDTSLNYYKNEGSATNPVFRLNSQKYLNLQISAWFFFVDIDANGTKDLFTGGPGQTIQYFKNTGTPTAPNFVLTVSPVKTNTDSVVFSESICIPTFADIDNDGDLDYFTGNSVGTVSFYKNIGTPQNFNFQFITNEFAGLQIIGGADDPRHGASSVTFADIGNGKLDWFWGDFFGHSVYYMKNTGTLQNFQFSQVDTNSPPPNPWQSVGFNMPGLYDIDGDGKKDFFVGSVIGSETKDNFGYYKNLGPAGNPQFALQTRNFIPCIDVGSNSYPAFADIDNDGMQDLFIGSDRANISYYRNTGTSFNAAFTRVTDSLPVTNTSFNYAPTLGDLDGDGKKDMIIGAFDGKLRYFKNTGTVSNPVFTQQASPQFFDTVDAGQSSAPYLCDIDNDGKLDLIVGNSNGKLYYYKNNGTVTNYSFTLISNALQGIFVGNDSAPCLKDMDGDGDLDMLIGNRSGKIFYYRNDGTAASPNFTLISNNYAGINMVNYSVPALVDINSDTDIDLFVGNAKGGLYYYENRDVIGIQSIGSEVPAAYSLSQNYPNPFNPSTKISFNIPVASVLRTDNVKLAIYNIQGKEIQTIVNEQLKPGKYEVDWNAANLPSGVYFYKLTAGDFVQSRKMILLK